MAIADDFTVSIAGDIRYVGAAHGAAGAGYYTVIQFHRWLQDLADNAVASAASSDFLDITDNTPSERATDNYVTLINGFNIDQTASEHLYDGSIVQAAGDEIWDGLVVIAAEGMDLQIVQDGAVIASDFWNTIPSGETKKGLNRDVNNGISHRFLIQVRDAGADIDGRRILGQTREWGYSYSEFKVNGTARGNNVLALTYAADLNNVTASGTVAGWTTITNTTSGYNGIDVDNNSTDEYYYSEWNRAGYTINQFYERMKYLTRTSSAETLYGLNGELFRGITHEVNLTTPRSGTFSAFEKVTWGTGATAGEGQMLAINSTTAGTKMWIQLLKGVAPSGSVLITGFGSSATATYSGTLQERTLSFPFCGVSTGSALIGAYGFGVEATDLTSADKVFDLTNTQITPPNYVTFTVTGLISGEDYILVGPADGGLLDLNQFSLQTSLTADNVTAVVIGTTIPADTPSSGTIRVEDDNGVYRRLHYSSWATSTFTIDSTDGNEDFGTINATSGNDVFISYIDTLADATSEAFQAVKASGTRDLYIRVRDGGASPIKTYEATATLTTAPTQQTSAIRTSDM
jgi:hypothetical protein